MEPSIIEYWKNKKWVKVKRVFYTDEEVSKWYKENRNRVDGLSVVTPVKAHGQTTLTE